MTIDQAYEQWLEAGETLEKARALREEAEAVLLEDVEHMDLDCPRCGHMFQVNLCLSYHICPECGYGIG
jgi:hypothetical protein